jgi:hypothetical protein
MAIEIHPSPIEFTISFTNSYIGSPSGIAIEAQEMTLNFIFSGIGTRQTPKLKWWNGFEWKTIVEL